MDKKEEEQMKKDEQYEQPTEPLPKPKCDKCGMPWYDDEALCYICREEERLQEDVDTLRNIGVSLKDQLDYWQDTNRETIAFMEDRLQKMARERQERVRLFSKR